MQALTPERTLGRTSLLVTLGLFAGLTLLVVSGSLWLGAREREREQVVIEEATGRVEAAPEGPEPEVLEFLGELAQGEEFGGWRIGGVDPIRDGGLRLRLSGPEGVEVGVELRPLDERSPPPPASSERLAVYVRNGVQGGETPEQTMAAARALAEALRERERVGEVLRGLEALIVE